MRCLVTDGGEKRMRSNANKMKYERLTVLTAGFFSRTREEPVLLRSPGRFRIEAVSRLNVITFIILTYVQLVDKMVASRTEQVRRSRKDVT